MRDFTVNTARMLFPERLASQAHRPREIDSIESFRVCLSVLHSPFHSPETPSESVVAELARHASYEKPCTGGPPWPPRFPTPYSAFSAEFLVLVTASRSGAVRRSSLFTCLHPHKPGLT